MTNYLRRVLWSSGRKSQLIAAIAGSLMGFLMLLGAVQFYYDLQAILFDNKDLFNPEYIVINKRVSMMQTLNVGKAEFSDSEIMTIQEQEFIDAVVPFINNRFKVSAFVQSKDVPFFRTEIFFEAIPDDYLDIENDKWVWNKNKDFVPIIIPKDYLNLYNFGFAQSQGLPQVPGELVSMAEFRLRIRAPEGNVDINSNIVGYTDKINSILVPYEFLKWANENYATIPESPPSRLVVVSKDPSNPDLSRFLEEKGYETNKDKVKNSKMRGILRLGLLAVSLVSGVIIFLAFMVFILAFQIIITRSADKLRILINLGYNYLDLSKLYIRHFILLMVAINLVAFLILWPLKYCLDYYLKTAGYTIDPGMNWELPLYALLISFLLIVINAWAIIREVKHVGK